MLDLRKKPSQPLVAASILAADFGFMIDDCRDALGKGVDLLHVDVMDGHFVGNLTLGADMIRALRKHLPDTCLDVHLMVDHPEMFIEPFADAGANVFTFQLEVCNPVRAMYPAAQSLIEAIHDQGMLAGMAINPLTDARGLEPYLDLLDLVLVMSVHPGLGGQAFLREVLDKTAWLRDRLKPTTRLEMDGGLSPRTAPDAVAAGVDIIVAGSAVFGTPDRAAAIAAMHGSIG